MEYLSMDQAGLTQARTGLIKNGLIAWQKPIYQVLSLEPAVERTGMMSLKDLLGGAR